MKINREFNTDMSLSKLNKNQKLLLFGTLLFLLIFLFLYSIISYRFSAASAISKLQQAVAENDAKAAVSLIKSSDKKLIIDEKNIESFLTYLNKNPYKLSELIDTLHKQANSLGSRSTAQCWNYYLILKKSDKGFWGFRSYYFEMKPCYADISANYPSARIYVDGIFAGISPSKAGPDNTIVCGPFVQGQHTVRAASEWFFGKFETTMVFNLITDFSAQGKPSNCPCSIIIGNLFPQFSGNFEDAEIFVDGKDTGKKLSDVSLLGPITQDISFIIYAEREFPWGTFRSSEVIIDKDYLASDLSINSVNEKLISQLKTAVADYNRTIIIPALKSQSTPSSYEVSGEGGSLDEALVKEYKAMILEGTYFTGKYLYSSIDPGMVFVSYTSTDDIYHVVMTCTDYYDQDYGEKNSVIRTSKNGIINQYTAEYDVKNKKWSVMIALEISN